MRSAAECAEAARRCIRRAAREKDPEVKKRILSIARANAALARFADRRAKEVLSQRRAKEHFDLFADDFRLT